MKLDLYAPVARKMAERQRVTAAPQRTVHPLQSVDALAACLNGKPQIEPAHQAGKERDQIANATAAQKMAIRLVPSR